MSNPRAAQCQAREHVLGRFVGIQQFPGEPAIPLWDCIYCRSSISGPHPELLRDAFSLACRLLAARSGAELIVTTMREDFASQSELYLAQTIERYIAQRDSEEVGGGRAVSMTRTVGLTVVDSTQHVQADVAADATQLDLAPVAGAA